MTSAGRQAGLVPGIEPRPASPGLRAVRLVLPDGTPCYAPIGTVVSDGPRVQCHLCGGWYRSVLAHIRVHGWDQIAYRAAFGLERGQPLEGQGTRARRSAALRTRRVLDPAVRAGCELGKDLARSGDLTRAAAAAARGRTQPEQRRRKTLRTLASISPEARAAGSRRHADERLRRTAAAASARLGHPDIGSLVRERVGAGQSLAAISRAAGLHKDWLCRHLATVDPDAARDVIGAVTGPRHVRHDARWLPVVHRLGFPDVASYLTDRHVTRRHTVAAIAHEVGMTNGAVATALARHDLRKVPHATARARSEERAAAVAARFGYPDLDGYVTARRAAGFTWRAIAAECRQPATWVRRHAGVSR